MIMSLHKKICSNIIGYYDFVSIITLKPQRCILLKKASILSENYEPHSGRAYAIQQNCQYLFV